MKKLFLVSFIGLMPVVASAGPVTEAASRVATQAHTVCRTDVACDRAVDNFLSDVILTDGRLSSDGARAFSVYLRTARKLGEQANVNLEAAERRAINRFEASLTRAHDRLLARTGVDANLGDKDDEANFLLGLEIDIYFFQTNFIPKD